MSKWSLNILVVQSDPVQARRVHQLLLDLGHESEVLGSGNVAYERIKTGPPVDLLVTELSLPGRDGLTLVAELRKRFSMKQAAAVVITSSPGLVPQAQRLVHSLGIEAVLLTRSPAVETLAALKKALEGKGRDTKLVPHSPDLLHKAAPAVAASPRRVASIHLAMDLPQDEALERMVQEVAECFGMTGALLSLLPDYHSVLALHWRSKDLKLPPMAPADWDFMAPRSDAGVLKPLMVADARNSFTLKSQPIIKAGALGSFASLPLATSEGKPVGFLSVFDLKARSLNTEEHDLLAALAKRAGREIAANAMLHDMRNELAAQWQLAMDRESLMGMLRGVLEALHLGVLLQDPQGKTLLANSRLADLMGQDPAWLKRLDDQGFYEAFLALLDVPEGYAAAAPSPGRAPLSLERVLETKRPRRQVLRWTALPIHTEEGDLQLQLWEEITAEVDLQAQRAGLVTLDPLTELLNRRGAEEELQRETARAKRNKRPYSLLRIYVHELKAINQKHGYADGDLMLQAVGVCLRKSLRLPDRPCRWSGSHFFVILPETPHGDGLLVAARIRDAVAALDLGFAIAVSIGVSNSAAHHSASACLAVAEVKLEVARKQGPGTVVG